MKNHLIIDFSFLYYKYKFTVESGRIKKVSADITGFNPAEPDKTEHRDISMIYYPLREIETLRRQTKDLDGETSISICFDMPSARKEESSEYKANRTKKLTDEDLLNIGYIAKLLEEAGYSVYRQMGTEADDLIYSLIKANKDSKMFGRTVVVTPDLDLAVNICDDVALYRYKQKNGYSTISKSNFVSYMQSNLGTFVPYNAIDLYKCTVGDSSDNIKGIHKFGNAAFSKLVSALMDRGVEFERLTETSYLYEVLNENVRAILGDAASDQAIESFNLVKPITVEVELKESNSNVEARTRAYSPLGMKSLID